MRSSTGGAITSASARARRGRRPLHLPAAVPRQRAECLRPGARRRAHLRRSARASRPRASGRGSPPPSATVTYLLGAMVNILHGAPARLDEDRAHKVRVALAPATPAELFDGSASASGCSSSRATARPRPTARSVPRSVSSGRARWAGARGLRASVVDEDDRRCPTATPASSCSATAQPFTFATGYLRMPEETVEAWRNLWFHTGDRVVRDADGSFRFVDRIKDTIRRRGENISSYEVEQALLGHPQRPRRLFPVPPRWRRTRCRRRRLCATGRGLDPGDLMRHCEGRLAYFAIPRYVASSTELPRTENGKVREGRCCASAASSRATWDREAVGVTLLTAGPTTAVIVGAGRGGVRPAIPPSPSGADRDLLADAGPPPRSPTRASTTARSTASASPPSRLRPTTRSTSPGSSASAPTG